MSVTHKKNKNNMFLNQKTNDVKKDIDKSILYENRFYKDGVDRAREREKDKDVNINDSELFPSLLNDLDLFIVSKKNKKQEQISYKDIANNICKPHKEETDEVDPGWVYIYKDSNYKIHFLYGKKTETCLEIERKELAARKKKEIDELNEYIREKEEDRLIRMELYGNYYNFYKPETDKYYTREEDIVIYTANSNDVSDSETEGSNYDNEDYINDDTYL